MLRAIAASLQVMRGLQKLNAGCQAQKVRSVERLVVALPIVVILIFLILPAAPPTFSDTLHPDADVPLRLKTSHLPVKVGSETS